MGFLSNWQSSPNCFETLSCLNDLTKRDKHFQNNSIDYSFGFTSKVIKINQDITKIILELGKKLSTSKGESSVVSSSRVPKGQKKIGHRMVVLCSNYF